MEYIERPSSGYMPEKWQLLRELVKDPCADPRKIFSDFTQSPKEIPPWLYRACISLRRSLHDDEAASVVAGVEKFLGLRSKNLPSSFKNNDIRKEINPDIDAAMNDPIY